MHTKRRPTRSCLVLMLLAHGVLWATETLAANCEQTSVGFTPVNDLATGLYLGQFQGGLYPNGSNELPPAHASAGLARAQNIQPLDVSGDPSPDGKYVLLSIGMSNTTQEFCSHDSNLPCNSWTFMGRAAVHPDVNRTTLAIVNGAAGGQATAAWESPTSPNYDRVRDTKLAPQGLSEAQVQIVWVKQANPRPTVSLPDPNADASRLVQQLANIARAVKLRYPNVKLAFYSSRIYAGYASTSLNPEPYAYESGFAVKWLIEAQVNQMAGGPIDPLAGDLNYDAVAPWIAWGPYLWADGLNPRSDGLIWECADLQSDGTHPSTFGESKVGAMLLNFMLTSPFAAPWFRAAGGVLPGDFDADGDVDLDDFGQFSACFNGANNPPAATCPPGVDADLDDDGDVDLDDFSTFAANYTGTM